MSQVGSHAPGTYILLYMRVYIINYYTTSLKVLPCMQALSVVCLNGTVNNLYLAIAWSITACCCILETHSHRRCNNNITDVTQEVMLHITSLPV